ncbi:MAG: hypothetical protein FJ215_04245 [Ignavibacteria bacterium]|nr:hypothetical protein [Ignavibacteria bacterium]
MKSVSARMMNPRPVRALPVVGGLLLLVGTLGAGGCSELLPEYRDPRDVFKGIAGGRYVLSRTENSVRIDLIVVNTFDETLEARGILEGVGTIAPKRDVGFTKTFRITPANWARGKYNPLNGRLTMNPGDTLVLAYTWDYRDDLGRDLRESFFRYTTDPACTLRRISDMEIFALRFRLKVFEKVAEVESEASEYEFCHVSAFIDPKACVSIRTDLPCSQW